MGKEINTNGIIASMEEYAGQNYRILTRTSINRDLICGWIHLKPDRNAGSSLAASSVLTKVSSLNKR